MGRTSRGEKHRLLYIARSARRGKRRAKQVPTDAGLNFDPSVLVTRFSKRLVAPLTLGVASGMVRRGMTSSYATTVQIIF